MTLPEGYRGRWLALGILLIVLGTMFRFVTLPLASWYVTLHEARQQLLAELRHTQRIVRHLPALQAHHQQSTVRDELSAALWPGANRARAAANLQHVVQHRIKLYDVPDETTRPPP